MKKFEWKLNADAPGQHTAILVLGFIIIWMSMLDAIKGPSDEADKGPRIKGPYAITGETLYKNPQLTWYERYFCSGYQRSTMCSFRLLHPFKSVFDSHGVVIREQGPRRNNVIYYRGPLPGNRALSNRVRLSNNN